MKNITISFGHKTKTITETELRKAQRFNMQNLPKKESKIIDAVLSYFSIHYLTVSDKN